MGRLCADKGFVSYSPFVVFLNSLETPSVFSPFIVSLNSLPAPLVEALLFVILFTLNSLAWSEQTNPLTTLEQRQVEQHMNLAISDPRSEHAFQKLYSIYKKHNREYELLKLFRGAIELDKKNKNLHVLLGQTYIEFRDYYMAEKRLRSAVKIDPQDYYARYLLAEVLIRKGEPEKAIAQYGQSIALTTDVSDIVRSLENLGKLYASQKMMKEAEEVWDKALEHRKYDPSAHRRIAGFYSSFGMHDKAAGLYKAIIKMTGKSPKTQCLAHVSLGKLLESQQKLRPAIESYGAANEFLDEDNYLRKEIDEAIFRCHEGLNDLETLQKQLEQKLKDSPNDPDPLRRLADIQIKLNQHQQAAATLTAAIELSPEDVGLIETLIGVHRRQKSFTAMLPLYEKLLTLNDENLAWVVGLGEAKLAAGQKDRAIATWQKLVVEPDSRKYELLGRTLHKHAFDDQAVEAFQKAVEADPESAEYRLQLGKLLLTTGKKEDARKVLDPLLADESSGAPIFLEVAEAYSKAGMDEPGTETLEAGLARDPSNYEITRRLAEVAHNGKDYPKAADLYYKAIDNATNLDDKLALNRRLINIYMNHMPKFHYEEDGKSADMMPLYALGEKYRQRMLKETENYDVYMLFGQVNEAAYYNPAPPRPFRLYRHRATVTYEDVMGRNPLYLEAYFNKARRHTLDDDFERAVLEYKKLLVINPVNKWKYYKEMGDLFANMGYMEQAFRFWKKVDVRSFSEPDLLYQLATRYFRAERPDDAIRILKKAIGINPNNYKYHLTLGNLYDHRGQHKLAIDEFRRTLALSTSDMLRPIRKRMSEVQTSYAEQLFADGKVKDALTYFEEIRDFQEVLNRHLKTIDPHYPDTLIQIARCCERLGQQEKATGIYQDAVGKFADHEAWLNQKVSMSIPYLVSLKVSQKYRSKDRLPEPAERRALRFALRPAGKAHIPDAVRKATISSQGIILDTLDRRWIADPANLSKPPTKQDTFHRYKRRMEVFDDLTCIVVKSERQERKGEQFDMLEAYDHAGKQRWQYVRPDEDTNIRSITRTGDMLLLNSGPRGVEALEAATGKPLWPVPLARTGGGCRGFNTDGSSIAIKHFKNNQASEITLVFADVKTGKISWQRPMGKDRLWHDPLILGDIVFALEDFNHEMHALSTKDGTLLYKIHFDSIFPRQPITDGKRIYVHERDMKARTIKLHALEPTTGETLWVTTLKMPSIHRPPIHLQSSFFYIDTYYKRILAINLEDGTISLDHKLLPDIPKYVFEESIVKWQARGRRIFIITDSGRIFSFDLSARKLE